MDLFAIIEQSKNNRVETLDRLIVPFIDNNLSLIIVNNQPGFLEVFKNKNIKLFSSLFCQVYAVKDEKTIKFATRYLSRITVWYKPVFHVLIGERELPQKISEYLSKEKASVKKMERDFKKDILGFIEPLDDDLRMYGNDKIKTIIQPIFPESILRRNETIGR